MVSSSNIALTATIREIHYRITQIRIPLVTMWLLKTAS
jgi:hypothetical protein